MKLNIITLIIASLLMLNCKQENTSDTNSEIPGFSLLSEISGHWVGENSTALGHFEWFAFDFRPISPSHIHSIYEGATLQNIINSFFVADFDGKQQIMGRNGGWLGNQYRATYFVLDKAEETENSKYFRLSDAVGGAKRSYMEFRFENDTLFFNAYKDDSGTLDEPILHMQFKGTNLNPSFAQSATNRFNFPQKVSEVDLNGKFTNLIDPESALFLEEHLDPFPKSDHGHLSDLTIKINRASEIENERLLLYISKDPITTSDGMIHLNNLNTKVIRTISIADTENEYTTAYLHPDTYYITVFSDKDGNFYPSSGDITSVSTSVKVDPETFGETEIEVDFELLKGRDIWKY